MLNNLPKVTELMVAGLGFKTGLAPEPVVFLILPACLVQWEAEALGWSRFSGWS